MNMFKTLVCSALSGAVVLSSVFVGQAQALGWTPTYNYKTLNGTSLVNRVITGDGTDTPYVFKERANNLKVTAPLTNTSSNLRQFFWPANSPIVQNGMSCSTWKAQTDGLIQQGAALNIVETPEGSLRGITVTKNIMYGAHWIFNVHVWDSQAPGTNQIAGIDMGEVTGKIVFDENGLPSGNVKPLAWKLCARTIGTKLQFKIWTDEPTQPSWNDPKYAREVTIPEAWAQPGKTGWYIGHIKPGHSATFQGLQTSYRP